MTDDNFGVALSVPVSALPDCAGKPASEPVPVPGVRMFLKPLGWDVGLPTAAYYLTRAVGGHVVTSLLVATGVAGLRVLYVAARDHRFDAVAAFLLAVFGVGLAASFLTGNPRFLLAKDSIPTAVSGLIFLGTCVAGRPLAYSWGRRMVADDHQGERRWTTLWAEDRGFRRALYVTSLAWGCGLLLEAAVRLALLYALPIDVLAGVCSALSVTTVVALAAWTVWYAHWVQR